MDFGTFFVLAVGAAGLITILWFRTRSHREAIRYRAKLMDAQARPHQVDFETRQLALGHLIKGDKPGAIMVVHERSGLDLSEARRTVEGIERALREANAKPGGFDAPQE